MSKSLSGKLQPPVFSIIHPPSHLIPFQPSHSLPHHWGLPRCLIFLALCLEIAALWLWVPTLWVFSLSETVQDLELALWSLELPSHKQETNYATQKPCETRPRFLSVIGILLPSELRCAESFLHGSFLCLYLGPGCIFSGKYNRYPFQLLEEILSYFYYRHI